MVQFVFTLFDILFKAQSLIRVKNGTDFVIIFDQRLTTLDYEQDVLDKQKIKESKSNLELEEFREIQEKEKNVTSVINNQYNLSDKERLQH